MGGKSLILMGKKKNNNNDNKIGKKPRARNTGITLLGHTSSINLAKFSALHLFGDRIRSSNLFVVTSRTRITDDFINIFNGITSPSAFLFPLRFQCHCGFNFIFRLLSSIYKWYMTYGLKTQIATVYRQSFFQVEWLIATLINESRMQPSFM